MRFPSAKEGLSASLALGKTLGTLELGVLEPESASGNLNLVKQMKLYEVWDVERELLHLSLSFMIL
jgi:hypothetical protein